MSTHTDGIVNFLYNNICIFSTPKQSKIDLVTSQLVETVMCIAFSHPNSMLFCTLLMQIQSYFFHSALHHGHRYTLLQAAARVRSLSFLQQFGLRMMQRMDKF